MARAPRMVEGVAYWPFVVRFQLADGRRRVRAHWAPAYEFARQEITRALVERYGFDGLKPRSVTIRQVAP